jgi:predicted small lipoprotein YifL
MRFMTLALAAAVALAIAACGSRGAAQVPPGTRVPGAPAAAPTLSYLESYGPVLLPPADSQMTDDAPPEVRSYIDSQLAGQTRVGAPRIWIVLHSREDTVGQYGEALKILGWKIVADTAGGPPGSRVIMFEQENLRLTVLFYVRAVDQSLVYAVVTRK